LDDFYTAMISGKSLLFLLKHPMPKLLGLIFLFMVSGFVGCKNRPENSKSGVHARGLVYNNETTGRINLQLPDGSSVLLDTSSVIRLSAGFNKTNRELSLEGAALFRTAMSGLLPFVVHTKALRMTVISTAAAFKIDGFPGSPGEEVDLLSGELKVMKSYHSKSDNEPAELKAGEMVMINTDIELMEKESFDSAALRDWIGK
jgi:transmembrane sensor